MPTGRVNRSRYEDGEWSETCIGVWSRNMMANNLKARNSLPVCTGINLVRVRNMEINSVKPTSTVGIQVIIQDTTDNTQRGAERTQTTTNNSLNTTQRSSSQYWDYWTTIKEKSNTISHTFQDIAKSEQKIQFVTDMASKSYKSFREWIDRFRK